MSSIKEEYNENIGRIEELITEEKNLVKDEKVKKYLKLKKEIQELETKKHELYRRVKYEEYDLCRHLFIINSSSPNKSCGCIRCGLDNDVKIDKHVPFFDIDIYNQWSDESFISEKAIMKSYFKDKFVLVNNIGIEYDLELGRMIYQEIIETNPDIDDKKIIELFRANIKENDSVMEKDPNKKLIK